MFQVSRSLTKVSPRYGASKSKIAQNYRFRAVAVGFDDAHPVGFDDAHPVAAKPSMTSNEPAMCTCSHTALSWMNDGGV